MLQTDRDLLVCIFQRGAADGLNSVVPHGDDDYYLKRSNINVPKATASHPDNDLDGFFGFHPALAPLKPTMTSVNWHWYTLPVCPIVRVHTLPHRAWWNAV